MNKSQLEGKDSATREFLLTHNKGLNTQTSRIKSNFTDNKNDLSKIIINISC